MFCHGVFRRKGILTHTVEKKLLLDWKIPPGFPPYNNSGTERNAGDNFYFPVVYLTKIIPFHSLKVICRKNERYTPL